jgi:hypothetical protein
MENLTSGEHLRLGDALLAAQDSFYNNETLDEGKIREHLAIYHLLADPATRIQ